MVRTPRQIRIAARVSQIEVAVAAGVSDRLVREYERDPHKVKDEERRARLACTYDRLAALPCVDLHGPQRAA